MNQRPPNVTAPAVNLNGTCRADLLQQHVDVEHALAKALVAMHLAFPHGRDFQISPPTAHTIAMSQARDRLSAVENVLRDFQALIRLIHAQESR